MIYENKRDALNFASPLLDASRGWIANGGISKKETLRVDSPRVCETTGNILKLTFGGIFKVLFSEKEREENYSKEGKLTSTYDASILSTQQRRLCCVYMYRGRKTKKKVIGTP